MSNRVAQLLPVLWLRPAIGALAVLAFIWVLLMDKMARFQRKINGSEALLPQGLKRPDFAIQVVRSAEEINQVLLAGNAAQNKRAMRTHVAMDYGFMALYWLLLIAFSALLAQEVQQAWAPWVAFAAALTVTITVMFDLIEDRAILRALETPEQEVGNELARNIRRASLVKWGLFYFTALLLAVLLVRAPRDGRNLAWPGLAVPTFAVLFVLMAGVGFAGLFHKRAIEWAAWPMALALLLAGEVFLIEPIVRWLLKL